MRDLETMRMALTAAGDRSARLRDAAHELGGQGSRTASSTPFPPPSRRRSATVLAEVLRAVVAQQLLRQERRRGRIPAFEILLGSTALANAVRKGRPVSINNQIQTGRSKGMIAMDQS
jgi:twitching motility protein PilT